MKRITIAMLSLCALLLTFPAGAQGLKPSAAALASDPGARDNSIRDGYSKPTSEIRAAYEHLDPALFIYRPYYQGDNRYFYYVEADPTAKNSPKEFNDRCYKWFMYKAQDEYGVRWKQVDTFIGGTPGHDGEYVLYGEHTMHAGFAEVIADPGSSNPFNHFLHACSILEISSECAVVFGGSYNGGDRMIRYSDGNVYPMIETVDDQLARNRRMKKRAEAAILKESPFALLEFMADWIWERYQDRQKDGKFYYIDAVEYLETYALMAAHPDVSSSDASVRTKAQAAVNKHKAQCEEVQAKKMEFYLANGSAAKEAARAMTMAEIPKPGMSDASLEATFKSLALKSQALSQGVEIKKVIIRDAGWNYDRNELGVITARYKGAYLIYSYNGKIMMKDMSFKQPATGGGSFGSWQYRGIGTETRTITDWK
ncbi:MAG: hypothetical protein IJ636_03385 [Bacteroidales bacterium]|nr:hypothetical protein [Bacteroidales bacterium]